MRLIPAGSLAASIFFIAARAANHCPAAAPPPPPPPADEVLVRSSGNGRGPRFRYRSTEATERWPLTAIRLSPTFRGQGSTSWTRVFTSCALPALSVIVSALWVYC